MKKHSILIIDDNEETCEKTRDILQLENYNVSIAHKGQEGLDVIRKESFQLILCKVELPDMTGYEIMNKLSMHPDTSTIPVVLMSSDPDDHSFRNAMKSGATDFLSEPFTGEDLLNMADVRVNKRDFYKSIQMQAGEEYSALPEDWKKICQDHELFKNKMIKEIKSKETLFHEGDFGSYIYYILSGKIHTSKSTDCGKSILTDICQQGDFLGYSIGLSSSLFQESAVAQEDSEVVLIPKRDFIDFLYKDKRVFRKFAQDLSCKLHRLELQLMNLAYNSARKRVSDAILFIFGKYNKNNTPALPIPFNRSTLSSLAAVSNECVSRNLTDLRYEGLIRLNRRGLFVLDYDKLKNIRN